MTDWRKELEQLWISRWNQREESVLRSLSRLEAIKQSASAESRMELQILRNSLLRLQGRTRECQEHLEVLSQGIESPGFTFSLERGLCAFALGNYTEALDFFLVAGPRASGPLQCALALSNVLWCLENLGIEAGQTEGDLQESLDDPKFDPKDGAQICAEWEAYLVRKQIHRGKLTDALKPLERSRGLDHARYLQIWIARLPYFANPKSRPMLKTEQLHQELSESAFKYSTPYFFRTLSELIHPLDSRAPVFGFAADRLYLWVWRWMNGPEVALAQKISATLDWILHNLPNYSPTLEDRCLLVNALEWLGIMDPSQRARLGKWIDELSPVEAKWPAIFWFENLWIQVFKSRLSGNSMQEFDLQQQLQMHPLWGSHDLCFRAWSLEPKRLPLAMRQRLEEKSSGTGICVDLLSFNVAQDGVILSESEAICRALEFLVKEGSAEHAVILSYCFGIHRYESGIHYSKIANLVSRLRTILPKSIRVSIRGGMVQVRGDISKHVRLLNARPISESLRRGGLENAISGLPRVKVGARLGLKPQALQLKEFTREDLQARLKLSRSGATRMIREWLDQGWIVRQGKSKNCQYRSRSLK